MAITDFLKKKPEKIEVGIEEIYKAHKAEILKMVATEHLSTDHLSGLKYEVTHPSGHRYYSIPEQMALPFQRLAKQMEYMDWLKNGIDPSEFEAISTKLHNCLAHISAKTDQAEKKTKEAGLLIAEMDRRRRQALPYYVLINLVANVLIREDEKPNIISSQIHSQKCDEIQQMIEEGTASFFLTLPQLKSLSAMQSMSMSELTTYLAHLNSEAQKEKSRLEALISWKDADKGKTNSTKVRS